MVLIDAVLIDAVLVDAVLIEALPVDAVSAVVMPVDPDPLDPTAVDTVAEDAAPEEAVREPVEAVEYLPVDDAPEETAWCAVATEESSVPDETLAVPELAKEAEDVVTAELGTVFVVPRVEQDD